MHVEVKVGDISLGENISKEGTTGSQDHPVCPNQLVVLSEQGDIMELSRCEEGSVIP